MLLVYAEKIFHFMIFLGPLVFFHELGHFLFARLAGVRVEVFSIGFGPKLFRKKWGDTEYALSLIPLGGYVKMFGDNPLDDTELTEAEKKVAFTHKSKWRRFWIVFGGPLANFILAFAIYFFLVIGGEKVPEARVGIVPVDSDYYSLGLRSGDVLKKINDSNILSFDDLNMVDTNVKSITVNRRGENVELKVDTNGIEFIQNFSKIRSGLRAPIVLDENGKQFFISLTDKPNFYLSLDNLKDEVGTSFRLIPISSDIEKLKKIEDIELDLNNAVVFDAQDSQNIFNRLMKNGYYPRDLVIENVLMGSAADKAKLNKGDIIAKVNGKTILSFDGLRDQVVNSKDGEAITVTVLEKGKEVQKSLIPEIVDRDGQKIKAIGVQSGIVFLPLKTVEYKTDGLGAAFIMAYHRTIDGIAKTYDGFKKLILGEVSLNNLGGPLTIGKVASDSFNVGASMFLRLMAIISINLGLINLFPIPVLDGGHIVFLILEAINGGPLSKKKVQVAQQIGMSMLFLLIFVSLFNDISRLF
jgi:regulator of sigma E protease